MSYKLSPFTGTLDYYEKDSFKGILGAAPASPAEGDMYINSGNNNMYVYYAGTWQLIHALTGITYVTPSVGMPMGLLMALTYGFDA